MKSRRRRSPVVRPHDRFIDDGRTILRSFEGQVQVRCVRCDTPGVVRGSMGRCEWHASFQCAACFLSLSSSNGDWAGSIAYAGRRPCGYCGHQWIQARVVMKGIGHRAVDEAEAICSECGHVRPVLLEPSRLFQLGTDDPHFGMPLHLVRSTRHGRLWAYNEHHLAALRSYVQAKLRTRTVPKRRSMFELLPAWIKSARNRDLIVRELGRLEQLLIGPTDNGTRPGVPDKSENSS